MLWLSGCAMGGSEIAAPCPPVVEYSAADLTRAAEEVEALQEAGVIVRMLSDYAVLRDQARACGKWRNLALVPERSEERDWER